MGKVRIRFRDGPEIVVSLRQEMTPTVEALMAVLPFSSRAQTWGDEVYFEAPFHTDIEHDARAEMQVGDVAFWPDGDAIAIFYGPTPASKGSSPVAYSPCNIIGKVEGDPKVLRPVRQGTALDVLGV